MEVSVIGNPQARICRAELAYMELGFRFGPDVISGESRNRVSFWSQSSKLKEIGIRCSPRSFKCEAIVSDQVPFLKSTPKSRSEALFRLRLLGPPPAGNSYYQDMDRFIAMEKALRTWAYWVETHVDRSRTQVFFLSFSPTHDNPSDWAASSSSGSKNCYGETITRNLTTF